MFATGVPLTVVKSVVPSVVTKSYIAVPSVTLVPDSRLALKYHCNGDVPEPSPTAVIVLASPAGPNSQIAFNWSCVSTPGDPIPDTVPPVIPTCAI